MKPLIEWNEQLSTGWKFMDDDHARLVEMINTLHVAAAEGKGQNVVPGLVDDLVEYCRLHFAREETAMNKNRYPLFRDHKAQHEWMLSRVLEFEKGVIAGEPATADELIGFLADWLAQHIRRHDRDLARYLAKRTSVGVMKAGTMPGG